MNITVTDRAAQEVKHILTEQGLDKDGKKVYLRLAVRGGGCSGYQHKLDLDTETNEKTDMLFVFNGIDVTIDKKSALYVDGATIDFIDDLNHRGFKITNPAAKSTCGCGSSWSL